MAPSASPALVLDVPVDHGRADDEVDSGRAALPDADLIAEVLAGSQDAFALLYDRHVDVVFRASLRVNHDRSAASEVVQETFLALWDRAELFDPARGSLATWLGTIARNRAIDHLRKSVKHRALTFSAYDRLDSDDMNAAEWLARTGAMIGSSEPEPTPEDALADLEVGVTLARALATIAPDERQVIDLAYRAGLSQAEIAAELGWPLGTVKTRTRRALRRLREHLEGVERAS